MYSDWCSLPLGGGGWGHVTVLRSFPPAVRRQVVAAVLQPLTRSPGNPTHCPLHTHTQVKWVMEVLRCGLTLPLDGDIVKGCVDVYSDWLTALVAPPTDSTPSVIREEPDQYIQKILQDLYTLFLPRPDISPLQLQLCQQVLSAVQQLSRGGAVVRRETWETLLHFLLRISHAVLAPPSSQGAAEQLAQPMMAALFQVWLLACACCFPSPPYWKTMRELLSDCRRHPVAVRQWSRVTAALTSRLLKLNLGPGFPSFKVPEEDEALIPAEMDQDQDLVSQTWFRFLHMLSNPAELCSPAHQEVQRGGSTGGAGPAECPLQESFYTAMRGVSGLVDAFLGLAEFDRTTPRQQLATDVMTTRRPHVRDRLPSLGAAVKRSHAPSYGLSRPRSDSAPATAVFRLSMPSVLPSTPPTTSRTSELSEKTLPPSPLRPKVNALLHLFGRWLFDAALLHLPTSQTDASLGRRGSQVSADPLSSSQKSDSDDVIERGRAEACRALCKIFTSKKTGEDILPVYLSRFYMVLIQGLQVSEVQSLPVMAAILLHSSFLFCCDLKGVNFLLPHVTSALEYILPERDLSRFQCFVSCTELRRASIHILLSLLPLPVQLGPPEAEFRLLRLLMGALQVETQPAHTQMLLVAMLGAVQDFAVLEASGPEAQGTSCSVRQRSIQLREYACSFLLLVSQRLNSNWRTNVSCSLSALGALGGLAKVRLQGAESAQRSVVRSLCSFIVFQCRRPPPLHSRVLHSAIVAAFHCLELWILQHPALLDQPECLMEVLEIVELGISGSKSRQEQETRYKDDKEHSPASMRVKDAAEATLSSIMQIVGVCPPPDGSASPCSQLDESSLIGSCGLTDSSRFRYFVLDKSVMVAMLEQPPSNQLTNPRLVMLVRTASGRRVWNLQLNQQLRGTKVVSVPKHPPSAQVHAGKRSFPHVANIPDVEAHSSVAHQNKMAAQEVERLRAELEKQQEVEEQRSRLLKPPTRCRAPPPARSFQTARMLLSHLGLLFTEGAGPSAPPGQLVALDSSLPGFQDDLVSLDQLTCRSHDSASIFYVKRGQKTAAQVLSNMDDSSGLPQSFFHFLCSLGLPVEVRPAERKTENLVAMDEGGGDVSRGKNQVFQYRDALSEVDFIIPCLSSSSESSLEVGPSPEQLADLQNQAPPPGYSPANSSKTAASCLPLLGFKVLIVWLESFEDLGSFPVSDFLPGTLEQVSDREVQLIFIHPLRTGLFRLCFHGDAVSSFSPGDGAIVSRRTLGFMVRETVLNSCHRRRLDSDSASSHVRRKQKISEMLQRYGIDQSEASFYTALFQQP